MVAAGREIAYAGSECQSRMRFSPQKPEMAATGSNKSAPRQQDWQWPSLRQLSPPSAFSCGGVYRQSSHPMAAISWHRCGDNGGAIPGKSCFGRWVFFSYQSAIGEIAEINLFVRPFILSQAKKSALPLAGGRSMISVHPRKPGITSRSGNRLRESSSFRFP